jgi:lipoprotein antigen
MVAALAAGCSHQDQSPSAGESATKVVIDGQSRTVAGQVVCDTGPTGEVTITVGAADATGPSPAPPPAIIADVTVSDGPPYVSLLSIHLPDITLSTGRYRQVAQPTVVRDGKSYKINGQAAAGDNNDPSKYRHFEVSVTCP